METNKKRFSLNGVWAFLIVLFSMPLGHALMILCEHLFGDNQLFIAAFLMGFIGLIITLIGFYVKRTGQQTLLGFIGGLLFWTGWIEFGYVYIARRYGIEPLMENGEIVTKPEYLLMPSSIGFWAMTMLGYLFNSRTGCTFLNWIQRRVVRREGLHTFTPSLQNKSIITFMELNILLWTFYLLLLFVYDNAFLGDRHPITYIVAFGSLVWALYLFVRLIRIKEIGAAIRYAIPTVIIFWNFVEILGRWDLFKEIWVHPLDYVLEMGLMLLSFVVLIVILYFSDKKRKNHPTK
ncbi:hypothetical protein [Porphyromonas circumdentaria]|uniref:hypothetical protein n=1 Tax=Porphyromonas circumdentaria TaxID=29524 RepID=UPI0026DC8F8F|nr:hypothetical protein [Porphyromonas circumdentaria]MDO4722535.1 hypothetical protein [Porphyromonas circumdentaria]